jgi:hypothetical protein
MEYLRVPRLHRGIGARVWRAAEVVLPEFAIIAAANILRYTTRFGKRPNLRNPTTFNEKVLHRIIFDRDPVWARLQDKYAVRDYVRAKIGDHVLTRLHWMTTTPSDIPFDDLPVRFIVKPTHGSGWSRRVTNKAQIDRRELIETCESWLRQNYYSIEREWVYKHIKPRILVEEYLSDHSGLDPIRYKIYVFHGRARVVHVGVGTPGHSRHGFYGRDWRKLPAHFVGIPEVESNLRRPPHLDDMLRYAETLADGFDFIRVDLYDTADRVCFGELTVTPGGGACVFSSWEFDRDLGAMWQLSTRRKRGPSGEAGGSSRGTGCVTRP